MANRSQDGRITGNFEAQRNHRLAADVDNEGTHWPRVIVETVEGPLAPGSAVIGAVNGVSVVGRVQPVVTAGTYAVSKVIGGILTFSGILPANGFGGVLESITVKFNASAQTVGFWVSIFKAQPSNNYGDTNSAAITVMDSSLLIGSYHLTTAMSLLGTHTIYNLDGIGKALQGQSQNLYVVVVPDATTASLVSTQDMIVELGMLWG